MVAMATLARQGEALPWVLRGEPHLLRGVCLALVDAAGF